MAGPKAKDVWQLTFEERVKKKDVMLEGGYADGKFLFDGTDQRETWLKIDKSMSRRI